MWSLQDKACLKTFYGHEHTVTCILFANNNLYSASRDLSIRVWDVLSGHCLKTILVGEWIRDLDFKDSFLVAACAQSFKIIDLNQSRILNEVSAHENIIESCRFIPSQSYSFIADLLKTKKQFSRLILTASRDKTIRLYDNSELLYTFEGHENWVRCMAVHEK